MIYVRISNEGYYAALSRKQVELALQQSPGTLHECISSSDCLDLLQREAKSRHAHPPSKIVLGKLTGWDYIPCFIWSESGANTKFVFKGTGEIQVWFDEQLAGTYKNSYNVDFKSSLIIEVLQKVGYIPLYSFAQKNRVYLNHSGKICQWVTVQQLLPLEDHSPRPKLSKP